METLRSHFSRALASKAEQLSGQPLLSAELERAPVGGVDLLELHSPVSCQSSHHQAQEDTTQGAQKQKTCQPPSSEALTQSGILISISNSRETPDNLAACCWIGLHGLVSCVSLNRALMRKRDLRREDEACIESSLGGKKGGPQP